MIITVNGADFSKAYIGETNGYSVIVSGRGTSTTNWVDKDVKLTMSITITANYTYESLEITVGGNPLNSGFTATHNNGTVTLEIPANLITGVVRIKVNASTNTGSGEVNPPGGDGGGSTTTNYTFTINPTPSTATVKLTASGYNQSSNSISVAAGTIVSWEVSATGYDTISGSHTINETKSLDVEITNLTNAEKIDTTEANVVIGKWINVEKGIEKDLAAWRTTNFVEIPSGATHVYSNDITLYRLSGNNTTPYGFYDNEKNYVSGIPLDVYPVGVQVPPGAAGKWRGVLKWPIPEGVKYVRVCWTYPGSGYVHELTGKKTAPVASPDVYFLKNN